MTLRTRYVCLLCVCTLLTFLFTILLMSNQWILADVCAFLSFLCLIGYVKETGLSLRISWHFSIVVTCVLLCFLMTAANHDLL